MEEGRKEGEGEGRGEKEGEGSGEKEREGEREGGGREWEEQAGEEERALYNDYIQLLLPTFTISKDITRNPFSQVRNQNAILESSFTSSVPSLNQKRSPLALTSKYLSYPTTHLFHWHCPNPGHCHLLHRLLQEPPGQSYYLFFNFYQHHPIHSLLLNQDQNHKMQI